MYGLGSFSGLSLCHTSSRCDAAVEHSSPLIKRQRSGAKPNLPGALLVAHKSNEYVGGGWQRAQLRKCSEGFRLVEKCEMVHLWPTVSLEVAKLQLALHIPLNLALSLFLFSFSLCAKMKVNIKQTRLPSDAA